MKDLEKELEETKDLFMPELLEKDDVFIAQTIMEMQILKVLHLQE